MRINVMKIKSAIMPLVVSSILVASCTVSALERDTYIGGGLNYLELDDEESVNFSVTTGHNLHRWKFESLKIQALTLGIEAQYSDSISGTDDVNNYSVFVALRADISEQWYLKIKQGYTNFPDVTLRVSGAEKSHIGTGIGFGYRVNSGSIELEYIYPNKTISVSLIEVSYKYHF
jgi:hypothetical protein